MDKDTRLRLITKEDTNIKDLIKDPMFIKNNYSYVEISEEMLKQLISENIEDFMKELGNSLSFVSGNIELK